MSAPINLYKVQPNVQLTDEIVAAELITSGLKGRLSCHKICIPPNAEYPPHEHPSEHIIILLEGSGYMRSWQSGREYRLPLVAGDVFHVPKDMPHQVGADSKGATMIAISVDSLSLDNPERMRIIQK